MRRFYFPIYLYTTRSFIYILVFNLLWHFKGFLRQYWAYLTKYQLKRQRKKIITHISIVLHILMLLHIFIIHKNCILSKFAWPTHAYKCIRVTHHKQYIGNHIKLIGGCTSFGLIDGFTQWIRNNGFQIENIYLFTILIDQRQWRHFQVWKWLSPYNFVTNLVAKIYVPL